MTLLRVVFVLASVSLFGCSTPPQQSEGAVVPPVETVPRAAPAVAGEMISLAGSGPQAELICPETAPKIPREALRSHPMVGRWAGSARLSALVGDRRFIPDIPTAVVLTEENGALSGYNINERSHRFRAECNALRGEFASADRANASLGQNRVEFRLREEDVLEARYRDQQGNLVFTAEMTRASP